MGLRTLLAVIVALTLAFAFIGMRVQEAALATPATQPRARSVPPPPTASTLNAALGVQFASSTESVARADAGAGVAVDESNTACVGRGAPACATVTVTIPAGSRIIRVRAVVRDEGTPNWVICTTAGPGSLARCGLASFAFREPAESPSPGPSGTSITWTAMNWSAKRTRDASVNVWYDRPGQAATQ